MYGVGSELCQGFCRLSAVHGGTFILNIDIKEITKDQNQFKVFTSDNQIFTCKELIASSDFSKFYNNCTTLFDQYI